VIESILLTDSDEDAVDRAVAQLDGWRVQRVSSADFANHVKSDTGVRAVLIGTDDPSVLRDVVERAHTVGMPVIVSCADDTIRRRAVELRVEEWY